MPQNTSQVRNIEFFQKQAKKLLKQYRSHDPEVARFLQTIHPHFAGLSSDQIFTQDLRLGDVQLTIARQHGFPSWGGMAAYMESRPRRVGGGIVISDKPGLSLEEALNDRASLAGMPPIGTVRTNIHGIEWQVVDYDFFPTPSTFARYPSDCDYLPIVAPGNISQRLQDFIAETDRCTSKRMFFIDTMPDAHPFRLGHDIHCANFGGDPEESYIFLDAARAHETTFAHELGHLWMTYVEGGDGSRIFRDRSDNGKINQLDFVQSFVLDLAVNDLIASRGFDMSLVNSDQINSLTMLRDAFALGHKPPTPREALLNSLTIAGAILEQKRWPDIQKQQLASLLTFFESATQGIYELAEQFVEIIHRHGYEKKEARRLALDECIMLAFSATGDDFYIERNLQEPILTECMRDKYPEQFAGLPVALKLEIGKAMARYGISGNGNVHLAADRMGMAQIMVETDKGEKIGPLPVNYQLIPYSLPEDSRQLQQPPKMIGGQIPDQFGRLPGDPGYNTCYPIGQDPVSRMEATQQVQTTESEDEYISMPHNRMAHGSFARHYMAGVGLSVARARLMQQMAQNGPNPYQYGLNNPVSFIDPSGLSCQGIHFNDPTPCTVDENDLRYCDQQCLNEGKALDYCFCRLLARGLFGSCECKLDWKCKEPLKTKQCLIPFEECTHGDWIKPPIKGCQECLDYCRRQKSWPWFMCRPRHYI
ncbi:MAG TPA: hypothetical protein VFW40_11570 [Capsulimonadaceae bacterium]|nr:hypothetical protein [Capsulimonadaceae bacterium]